MGTGDPNPSCGGVSAVETEVEDVRCSVERETRRRTQRRTQRLLDVSSVYTEQRALTNRQHKAPQDVQLQTVSTPSYACTRLTSQWFPTTIRFFRTSARNWRQNTLDIVDDAATIASAAFYTICGRDYAAHRLRGHINRPTDGLGCTALAAWLGNCALVL